MRVLVAADSFKGSLSTLEAAESIKSGILRVFPEAVVTCAAIADGGEGTMETLVESLGGEFRYQKVTAPNGGTVTARFGILENGTAVIEMAEASGLTLVQLQERNIMEATTYGTGELIRAALDEGCSEILIGIGGSATNDGGVGMAQALGLSFRDRKGSEIGFGGGCLKDIDCIDFSKLDERIFYTKITVMCDVKNPLCGSSGAARIYGPQKGASREQVLLLDEGLAHLADLLEQKSGEDLRNIEGAGAAGGLGLGLAVFLGAELKSGIQAVMDAAEIESKIMETDLVITGEGQIDNQSVNGKVISGIAAAAGKYHKPVAAVAGSLGADYQTIYETEIQVLEAAVCRPMLKADALRNAKENVADAAERIMRAVNLGMNLKL